MSNQFRPENVMPKVLIDELLRLFRLDRNWMKVYKSDDNKYMAKCPYDSWATEYTPNGATLMGTYALSQWLGNGPKVFKLTQAQQDALAQVDLTLPACEFTPPFPAILVQTDVPPFYGVVVYWHEGEAGIISNALTRDSLNDVTTTIYADSGNIEDSILRYDDDCRSVSAQCHRATRIALNACLALSQFGCHQKYLFPYERSNDFWLANQKTPKGEREAKARQRLAIAPKLLTFAQDVKLHVGADLSHAPGEPTGREVRPHWRRGHWRRVNYGKDLMQLKRVFIRPVLVRADRFVGDVSATSASYSV